MKTIQLLSAVAMLTSVSAVALAHGGGRCEGHQGGRPGARFSHMDTNNDGKVTPAEADAAGKARFTKLDTNKDGAINGAEVQGHPRLLERADANKDGKVTLAEMQAQGQKWFSRLDANSDKVLTRDEIRHHRGPRHGS